MQPKSFSLDKLRNYADILKYLFTDSVWRFKGKSLLLIASGFLGVIFQVQAISLALYYAKLIEKGEEISRFGYSVNPRTSIWFLFLIGAGVLISFLLSAWLKYFSRTGEIRIMRKYIEICTLRTFTLFGSNLRGLNMEEKDFSNDSIVLKLASKDAKLCGKAFLLMLRAIVPIITFLVAVVSLLYINSLLTLLIFALIGVSVRFQYNVNIQGARSTSLLEKYSRDMRSAYRNIIKSQKVTAVPILSKSDISEKISGSREMKRYHDAYEGRLRAAESGRFISDVLLAAAVFAIMVVLGSRTIMKGSGWGSLIIYLVALRYMMVNLKQSVSMITSINRFFPHLKRYFGFLLNIERRPVDSRKIPENYVVTVDDNLLNCVEDRREVKRGSRIGLISSIGLNRYTVAYLADSLLDSSSGGPNSGLESIWFVSLQQDLPSGIRNSFGLPEEYNWPDLRKDIEGSGMWDRFEKQVPHDLEKKVNPDLWKKVDPDIKFVLNLLSAVYSDVQIVMIEEAGLRLLPDDACDFFLKRFSERIAVIVFKNDISGAGRYKEEMIAVVDLGKTIGLGTVDWVRKNSSMIFSALGQVHAVETRGGESDDTDDDLDDEDDDM